MCGVDRMIPIKVGCMKIHNEFAYFSEWTTGDLFRYDFTKCELTLLYRFGFNCQRAFGDIVVTDDKAILIPFFADAIYEVDICKRVVKGRIVVGDGSFMNASMYAFTCGTQVYFASIGREGIWEYSIVSRKLKYFSYTLNGEYCREDSAYYRKGFVYAEKLYLPSCRSNAIVIFDYKSKEFSEIFVGDHDDAFAGGIVHDSKMVLIPRVGNKVVIYDINVGKTEMIYLPTKNGNSPATKYNAVVPFDNKLYFIPESESVVLSVNEVYDISEVCVSGPFTSAEIRNGELVIFSPRLRAFVAYSGFDNCIEYNYCVPLEINCEYSKRAFVDYYGIGCDSDLKHTILYEDRFGNLLGYLNCIREFKND